MYEIGSRFRQWEPSCLAHRPCENRGRQFFPLLQIASYELGKLLPEEQRPLPLGLMRIGDSRSDVVPNGGGTSQGCTDMAL